MRTRSNLATERSGVNFVRQVVEDAGCLFKEINLQHDFGHDATIVLVVDNQVQPREIALQIKSGASYNSDAGCHLPATADHIDFWARHDLKTLGVVYDPAEETAYWVDLQADCRARQNQRLSGGATISFAKASWNRFDATHFPTVLIPILLGSAPTIPLSTAIDWTSSTNEGTHDLGAQILNARHMTNAETWDCFIDLFLTREAPELSAAVPIAFAKLLGHDELCFDRHCIAADVRQTVSARILSFGAPEIAKLLRMLPEEDGFDRGDLGYAFLPVLGGRSDSRDLLCTVRDDAAEDDEVRQKAAQLIAWQDADPEWWLFWRRTA